MAGVRWLFARPHNLANTNGARMMVTEKFTCQSSIRTLDCRDDDCSNPGLCCPGLREVVLPGGTRL